VENEHPKRSGYEIVAMDQRICEQFFQNDSGSQPPADDADMDLQDDIQRIALEWPCYGWCRVTAELRRRGWTMNHKRVRRVMREDHLLCLRRRKFVVTTDSNH